MLIFIIVAISSVFYTFANSKILIRNGTEGRLCFNVKPRFTFHHFGGWTTTLSTSAFVMEIILNVDYPTTSTDAGKAVIERVLPGEHELVYKYSVKNMLHNLDIVVDGVSIPFKKSTVPRWYTVSTFRDVTIIAGDEVDFNCTKNATSELSNLSSEQKYIYDDIFKTDISSGISSTTFQTNDKTDLKKSYDSTSLQFKSTGSFSDHFSTSHHQPSSTPTHIPQLNDSLELTSEDNGKTNSSYTTEQYFLLTNTIVNGINYAKNSSSIKECISTECEHDEGGYTIILILVGVTFGLVGLAISISVIFHRKKKKLILQMATKDLNRHSVIDEYHEVEKRAMLPIETTVV